MIYHGCVCQVAYTAVINHDTTCGLFSAYHVEDDTHRKVHIAVNATETLDNSHLYVIQTLDDLNDVEWDIPGAVGDWSVKDTVAHLASYEHLLLEILQAFMGRSGDRRYITAYRQGQEQFNVSQVEQRKYETAQHVMDEYQDMQTQTSSLLAQIPADMLKKPESKQSMSSMNPPHFVYVVPGWPLSGWK